MKNILLVFFVTLSVTALGQITPPVRSSTIVWSDIKIGFIPKTVILPSLINFSFFEPNKLILKSSEYIVKSNHNSEIVLLYPSNRTRPNLLKQVLLK